MKKNNQTLAFSSFFSPAHILCRSPLRDRDAVILEVLRLLAYRQGIGDVDEAAAAVRAREDDTPTMIAPGIVLPHARLEAIRALTVGILTSSVGIVWGQDLPPVYLVILLLVPKDSPGLYLQAVRSLTKILKDPQTPKRIAELTTAEEVWRFFDRDGMILPPYVCAHDIMDPVEVFLSEHDTLERAIDLFVQHRVGDLPVVDKDGDLIGVVTTHELLKVCLPTYILWMDDLTPILNFEPFAEILRKESRTWLPEIMTDEYAVVPEDAPGIQVAKEITRSRVDHAYVVRGKKLIGVISLPGFLQKILRE